MSKPRRRGLSEAEIELVLGGPIRALADEHGLEIEVTLRRRGGGSAGKIDRVRLIEEMRARRCDVEAVQRLADLGRLSAAMVHEVRNVMTGVIGLAQVVHQRPGLTASTGMPLPQMIEGEARRGIALLSQFLRMASGAKAAAALVNLVDVARSTAAILAHHVQMAQLRLDVVVGTDVPPVWADADALRQVLINLALNAAEAAPGGSGVLRIETRRAGTHVEIIVADNGPGIPAEIRKRIFEPFFSSKRPGAGTGLGLYVCRKLVEADGGTIDVASQEGRGTTFTIRLPAAPSEPAGAGNP